MNLINASSVSLARKKNDTKSIKRLPLSNIINHNPSLFNTLDMIDFNNTLESNLGGGGFVPHSTKNKKVSKNDFSLQPKQKKKTSKRHRK